MEDKNDLAATICAAVYEETQRYYGAKAPYMADAALGFRILYGPPIVDAPILFIGFQPGGSSIEDDSHHRTWPAECHYATSSWPLARRMRAIWTAETLALCTGLNAIFFRASSVQSWRALPRPLRLELEAFSLTRAERIVRALSPQRIVVIGLATFDRLTIGNVVPLGSDRTLMKQGLLWGAPTTGVIHLSGARVSSDEIRLIANYVRNTGP